MQKMTSSIERITLNAATFSEEVVEPTFVNFFFGRNGAGKTTLAEAIKTNTRLEWQTGVTRDSFNMLVYDQDFIDRHFSNYDNLPGVFTIHEQNIQIQQKIDEAKEKMDEITEQGKRTAQSRDAKKDAKTKATESFQETCWSRTKTVREKFDQVIKGKKTKALFAEGVLATPEAVEHDLDKQKKVYDVAFDSNARSYNAFGKQDKEFTYDTLSGFGLLKKKVVSSSDTDFARFIKRINATDWVRQGHVHYTDGAEGKCPYCQQTLPATFEEDITACFDEQYQQDIDELRTLQMKYSEEIDPVIAKLTDNMQDVMPTVDLTVYKTQLALLQQRYAANRQKIENKIKEPSSLVELDDFEGALSDIYSTIDEINALINQNNTIANNQKKQQNQCRQDVWAHIAFLLEDEIQKHKKALADLDKEINALELEVKNLQKQYIGFRNQVAALNTQGINTEESIENINTLLRDSGFQGFSLRPKKEVNHTYEVIRHNGELADKLSEGERNFIAFLYFYQLVRGNGKAEEGKTEATPENTDPRSKIVVIDDPVSSMDSGALFIVSAIVREMVEVCYNNTEYLKQRVKGDYIKQIFILTHNVYFHREVTYQQTGRYKSVSFYLIRKTDNVSTVKLCTKPSLKRIGEEENYNPVQNSYAALWSEYKELTTPIPLLNVIRRILEYYFLQLCGYEGEDLRSVVLEKNKHKFVVPAEDGGKPDYEKYHMASAMLSYINNPGGISDGLNYVEESMDADQYKAVFKLIFEAMNQDQHYRMMMETDTTN